jgi:membrane protein
VTRSAAALAYYTAFSLAPFLVICIGFASLIVGKDSAQNQMLLQIGGIVGSQSAGQIHLMVENASKPSTSIIATIIGIALFLFGMTGVFGQLRDGLNTIWGVREKSQPSIRKKIQSRFFSFTTIMGVAFIFLVSLVLSTLITAWSEYMSSTLPGFELVWIVIDFVVSFVITSVLFAVLFKTLPDVLLQWKDIWIGAIVTALLFSIGKFCLELYLSHNDIGSLYGAAGSLIVILVWVYYSSQILFFGAEFTKVYSVANGKSIAPAKNYVLTNQIKH